MKRIYTSVLLLFCSVSFAQADVAHGEKIFKRACGFCHGNHADKPALNQSRPLNQLSKDEIVLELKKRKEGGGDRGWKLGEISFI